MVLDENGTVKEALMYQPYGTASDVQGITIPGTDPLRQKFTTKEFDEEGDENGAPGIKAYHFGFRVYDPEIGVWMSTDPADQYWNTYSYCGGDPVNFTDPDGRWVGAAVALTCAVAGGYIGGVAGNGGELNPREWTNWGAAGVGFLTGLGIGTGIGYGIEFGWFSTDMFEGFDFDLPANNFFRRIAGRWAIKSLYHSSSLAKELIDDINIAAKNNGEKVQIQITYEDGEKGDPGVGRNIPHVVKLNPGRKRIYTDPSDPNYNENWNISPAKVAHFHELVHRLHYLQGTNSYSTYLEEMRTTGLIEPTLSGDIKQDFMLTEKYNENSYRLTINHAYRHVY
jgi:RHS repeat-associated protein